MPRFRLQANERTSATGMSCPVACALVLMGGLFRVPVDPHSPARFACTRSRHPCDSAYVIPVSLLNAADTSLPAPRSGQSSLQVGLPMLYGGIPEPSGL